MFGGLGRTCCVSGIGDERPHLRPVPEQSEETGAETQALNFSERWDRRIREYGHQVFLSVLAMGHKPDRAREIVQATWTRLMEQDRAGNVRAGSVLGLAITQARFFALDARRRDARDRSNVDAGDDVELAATDASPEEIVFSRDELERVRQALAECSANTQKIFRLAYTPPPREQKEIAAELGLSVQRVRQVLSDTRGRLRQAFRGENQ